LSYWLITHEIDRDDPQRDAVTADLIGVAAFVYPAPKRAARLIARFGELMRNPAALR
jgi:hypothetical protein